MEHPRKDRERLVACLRSNGEPSCIWIRHRRQPMSFVARSNQQGSKTIAVAGHKRNNAAALPSRRDCALTGIDASGVLPSRYLGVEMIIAGV